MSGVYVSSIFPLPSTRLFQQLLPYIADERRSAIEKFWRKEDAWRSLLGESLARAAMVSATGVPNAGLSLIRDRLGKPAMTGGDGSFLSISHSGDFVACVFDSHPVGIDIELIAPIGEQSAAVVLTPVEAAEILPQVRAGELEQFFRLWTMKESYAKVSGNGHRVSFDSFTIRMNGVSATVSHLGGATEAAFFHQVEMPAGYCGFLCSLTHPVAPNHHLLSAGDIAAILNPAAANA